MSLNPDLLRAALEPVILEVIAGGASYGYEIAKAIAARSEGRLLTQEGTLYPALHRLEKQGALRSTWRQSSQGRRRKYYALTAEGRRQLESAREQWESFSKTVNQILGLAYAG